MAGRLTLVRSAGVTPADSVTRHKDYIPKNEAESFVRSFAAPFYDTVVAPTPSTTIATRNLSSFQQGIGGGSGDPVFNTTTGQKSYSSTNLESSGGTLPGGQSFRGNSMGIAIFPALTATGGGFTSTGNNVQFLNDAQAIGVGAYVIVGAGKTKIAFGTVQMWPAGYGVTGSAAGNSNANGATVMGAAVSNGTPIAGARNYFSEMPVSFSNINTFSVNLQWDTAINNMLTTVWCLQVAWWGTGSEVMGG